jgi:hypothetical protein
MNKNNNNNNNNKGKKRKTGSHSAKTILHIPTG